ncbi:ABC transporter permease [Pseudomonas sp. BN505]|uniref:FtsX-like permease family protein n=1 Tax=Pseudomonas putida TaxID=303 RepID=A0A7V8EBP6_PSEPU|nr:MULTISPECIES: ABC transporter permease [Pseudomonas]KAF0251843.1 FtsX-like permease family protein [Pseudomonas putida]MBS5848218.1 ABC transporter permease [Pseudomonas putida]MCE0960408.1 ABC transporter permease [Pseudomonas putida]MDD2117365.1 ABC transporter permease [Pseudomonas putida]MDH4843612.1 ABC transporter permease [Pseudomonas sp. BN605]
MKYAGILRIGYKLLVNDRAKFSALLVGLTFSVFLMMQMTAMFAGILTRAYSTVTNIGAPMWVMDPAVNTPTAVIALPDYLLDAVRSMEQVEYAVPVFIGNAQARLADGTYQIVSVVGLDDTSLYGRPELEQGAIEALYGENAFIVVHDSEFSKLGSPTLGTEFELNDHRGTVVGIAKVLSSGLIGVPTLYTTYRRAIEYIPTARFTISYILVKPRTTLGSMRIRDEVAQLGYIALTKAQFNQRIADYYIYQTGVGTNILLMTLISFLVGLSISGQTFYSFILENLDKFAALKAMGAKAQDLVLMILFMAIACALTGYGLGVGLMTGVIVLVRSYLPNYAAIVTFWNLGLTLGLVSLIAGTSSYLGIRKVLRVEPFEIFRS